MIFKDRLKTRIIIYSKGLLAGMKKKKKNLNPA